MYIKKRMTNLQQRYTCVASHRTYYPKSVINNFTSINDFSKEIYYNYATWCGLIFYTKTNSATYIGSISFTIYCL